MTSKGYFSISGSNGSTQLYFLGEPVGKSGFLEETKAVLNSHLVPDLSPRRLYESLVFCIASQSMTYERAVGLLQKMGKLKDSEFTEPGKVHSIAQPHLRFPEDSLRRL